MISPAKFLLKSTRAQIAVVLLTCLIGCAGAAQPTDISEQQQVSNSPNEQGTFMWPARGAVLARFDGRDNRGLDIGGTAGDPILAAADGRVVYAGSGLRGYGNMIIVKHNNTLLTAYAHNQKLQVREGDVVRSGQQIAEMGSSEADRVKLHFEVRNKGQAVDPEPYLLATSHRTFEPRSSAAVTPSPAVGSPSTGSGFAVTQSQIVTNAHVVKGCSRIEVADRGIAKLHAVDSVNDLALLDVSPGSPGVTLSQSRLRQGDTVTVIGYPLQGLLAQGVQVTTGNVTALAGINNNTGLFQISAPIQPGNSGGPVVDASGNVVGVVVSKLNALKTAVVTGDIPQNVNFALSLLTLRSFLESHNVAYGSTSTTKKLNVADVVDTVKPYTVFIKCFPEP